MIYFRRIFCWLRGIYLTIKTGVWLDGNTVSGHTFVEQDHGQPKCVSILCCTTCDEHSIGWEKEDG